MNRQRAIAVTVGLGLVAAALPWVALGQPRPAEGQPVKAAPKWEYATLAFTNQPIWTKADEEVYARDWKDLAERLKVPLKMKDPSPGLIRAAVLDHLGSQGWELASHAVTTGSNARSEGHTYTFRRPVP
jgi:hypothetical protein